MFNQEFCSVLRVNKGSTEVSELSSGAAETVMVNSLGTEKNLFVGMVERTPFAQESRGLCYLPKSLLTVGLIMLVIVGPRKRTEPNG